MPKELVTYSKETQTPVASDQPEGKELFLFLFIINMDIKLNSPLPTNKCLSAKQWLFSTEEEDEELSVTKIWVCATAAGEENSQEAEEGKKNHS